MQPLPTTVLGMCSVRTPRLLRTAHQTLCLVDKVEHSLSPHRKERAQTELPQTPAVCNTTDILAVNWTSAFFNFTSKRTRTKEDFRGEKRN